MQETADTLRAELETTRGSHHRSGYPPGLRLRVGAYLAGRRRTTGENWTALGKLLGIDRTTARTWAYQAETIGDDGSGELVEEGQFLSVCVEQPRGGSRLPDAVLVTPTGHRVEGLSSAALIMVLRGLE